VLELREEIKSMCLCYVVKIYGRKRPRKAREGFSEKREHSFIHQPFMEMCHVNVNRTCSLPVRSSQSRMEDRNVNTEL